MSETKNPRIRASKIELIVIDNYDKYIRERDACDDLGEISEIDGRATVHQLLFTIAMLLLDAGIQPKKLISEIDGRATVQITFHYSNALA